MHSTSISLCVTGELSVMCRFSMARIARPASISTPLRYHLSHLLRNDAAKGIQIRKSTCDSRSSNRTLTPRLPTQRADGGRPPKVGNTSSAGPASLKKRALEIYFRLRGPDSLSRHSPGGAPADTPQGTRFDTHHLGQPSVCPGPLAYSQYAILIGDNHGDPFLPPILTLTKHPNPFDSPLVSQPLLHWHSTPCGGKVSSQDDRVSTHEAGCGSGDVCRIWGMTQNGLHKVKKNAA